MKKLLLILLLPLAVSLNLTAMELSLADYMALVEENSKDLYQADINQQLADVQEKLARSQTRPMIAGSMGYTRNFIEITQPYPIGASPAPNEMGYNDLIYVDVPYNSDNDFSYGIGVQQLLFDMQVFKALEASRQYKAMTGSIYEATRQGILTAAKQVYYQTRLMEEVYQVTYETELTARETYEDIQKKYDSEMASELEVLQAQVNWQMNIPETTQAARNRDMALASLKNLAGLSPDEDVVLTDSFTRIPDADTSTPLGEIYSSRPDFQALQGEIELREINISAARAQFFPTLSASFSYGWQKSSDDFDFQDGTDVMSAGLSLTIPLYYGGSRFAQMEQARLELENSRVELLKTQDDIRTEIGNLQLLLDESSSRIVSAETTLKTAEKAYKIMEISSRNGLATQLDLKDARVSLSGARLNLNYAIFDYLNGYFQWQQAIGEGDKLPF